MKLLRNEVSYGHEVKFAHHVRSTFHSEATSYTVGVLHLPARANFIEKVLMQSIRTFSGGGGRIRTIEAKRSRFTVCPLWPLGNSPGYAVVSQRLGYYSTDFGFVKGKVKKE